MIGRHKFLYHHTKLGARVVRAHNVIVRTHDQKIARLRQLQHREVQRQLDLMSRFAR